MIVVVPSERVETTLELVRPFERVEVISGGETRRDSVARGLDRVGNSLQVVVHDAARPFVTASLLQRVVRAQGDHDGAIPAEPVEETVKAVDESVVVKTVDRSGLWRAQTPQAFTTDALRRAHEQSPGVTATDDAQLVELVGGTVVVVRGDRRNVKITYEEDFALAESLAASLS